MEAGKVVALYKVSEERRVKSGFFGVLDVEATTSWSSSSWPASHYPLLVIGEILPVRESTALAEVLGGRRWGQVTS